MRAVTVRPGQKDSARLIEVEAPQPGPGEVRVRVVAVGVDGTDIDINAGLYGEAPPGEEGLVIGHEAVGVVDKVGPGVSNALLGKVVVPTVRRGCHEQCPSCVQMEPDMCLTGNYEERGISKLQGYMSDYFVEKPDFLVKLPPGLRRIGILVEPLSVCVKAIEQAFAIQKRLAWRPETALVLGAGNLGLLAAFLLRAMELRTYVLDIADEQSIKANLARRVGADYIDGNATPVLELPGKIGEPDLIIEASGHSTIGFDAMRIVKNDGIVCLLSVTTGRKSEEVCTDCIEERLVMGNRAVFGSVSSNRRHFERAIELMVEIEARWPGVFDEMITRRLPLESFKEALQKTPGDIKPVLMPAA